MCMLHAGMNGLSALLLRSASVCPFLIAQPLSAQRTTSPLSTVIRSTSRSPASQPQSLRSLPAAALNSRCRFDLSTGGAVVKRHRNTTVGCCIRFCLARNAVCCRPGKEMTYFAPWCRIMCQNPHPDVTPSAKCSASILRLSGVSFDLVWNQPGFYAPGDSELLFIVFSAWAFFRCIIIFRCAVFESMHTV